MRLVHVRILSILVLLAALPSLAYSQLNAPTPQTGSINGTVTDTEDDPLANAAIEIQGDTPANRRTTTTNANGFFEINELLPGNYRVTAAAKGFNNWASPPITLKPGQNLDIPDITLKIAGVTESVTALYTRVEIATQQVHLEEEQRILGVLPNFYVVYEQDAVAMTTKLKFQLAMRSTIDPVTFLGVAFFSGIEQLAHTPDYVLGAKGYGQRMGANYADGVSDVLIGGAVLPSLLHQDPRYFYNGHGTKTHRTLYAMATPFICKGDNGHWQPNVSSIGGDIASAGLSNLYYPQTNRGVGLTFTNAAISTGGRMVNALAQEFIIRKLTPKAKQP
ncbi:MAG: carboxypeptidase-like regulatory domain-containing protein [Acidobacteriaceae bacterium]|nr:carboxypeptidase-like regulatory domain-containing protein [Acidobacteriaceae bacterium]